MCDTGRSIFEEAPMTQIDAGQLVAAIGKVMHMWAQCYD